MVTLTGDTFVVGPFVANRHYTVANVPAGLTLEVTRNSDTQVTLTLTGKAAAHANANDVNDLTITFLNAAFTGGNANTITGYTKSDLVVDFNDPAINEAPTANGVNITGTVAVGQQLTGNYTYADAENDAEGTSVFKWYHGDSADGTGKLEIVGANTMNYTLTVDDLSKYIFFEVIPVASTGKTTGIPVVSASTVAVTLTDNPPTAAPTISGTARVGQTLTASSGYADDDGDLESGTIYQWYRGPFRSNPIPGATSSEYQLTPADLGKTIKVLVTPRNNKGTGTAVESNPTSNVLGVGAISPQYPTRIVNYVAVGSITPAAKATVTGNDIVYTATTEGTTLNGKTVTVIQGGSADSNAENSVLTIDGSGNFTFTIGDKADNSTKAGTKDELLAEIKEAISAYNTANPDSEAGITAELANGAIGSELAEVELTTTPLSNGAVNNPATAIAAEYEFTLTVNPFENETITIGPGGAVIGQTYKFVTGTPSTTQIQLGATVEATASNIVTAINADADNVYTATEASGIITLKQKTPANDNTFLPAVTFGY